MHTLKQLGCDFVELVVDPIMLDELSSSEADAKNYPKIALHQLNLAVANTLCSYRNFSSYAQKTIQERATMRVSVFIVMLAIYISSSENAAVKL